MKKLEEMTVGDILALKAFKKNATNLLSEKNKHFNNALMRVRKAGNSLKRSATEKLIELGLYKTDSFIDEYVKVLEKRSELPATLRKEISRLGKEVYDTTIKEIIKNEEKENRGDSEDK